MTLVLDIYHSSDARDARKPSLSHAFADTVTSDEIARWIYNAEPERLRRTDLGTETFARVLDCVEWARRPNNGRGDDTGVSIAYWLTIAIHST